MSAKSFFDSSKFLRDEVWNLYDQVSLRESSDARDPCAFGFLADGEENSEKQMRRVSPASGARARCVLSKEWKVRKEKETPLACFARERKKLSHELDLYDQVSLRAFSDARDQRAFGFFCRWQKER